MSLRKERLLLLKRLKLRQAASNEVAVIYKGMSKGAGLKTKSNVEVGIDDDIEPSFDENASFRILSSTNNARFSPDGKKIIYDGSGSITIRYKYDDNPRTSGLNVTDIEVGDTIWKREFLEDGMHQERVDFREARLRETMIQIILHHTLRNTEKKE